MSRLILDLLWHATVETLIMVLVSGIIAVFFGLPLAVFMVVAGRGGLYPLPVLPRLLGVVIDAIRAVPFIILLVLLIPFTRIVVGSALGTTAAIVPLSIAAIPYFARIAEVSLREVDHGLVDAVRAMGGTRWMVIRYVLLPESMPALVSGITVTLVTLVGASAMAGTIGAGGLGDLAIRYGYQRFNTTVMLGVVAVLIVLVTGMQALGNWLSRILRHSERIRIAD
ncbi:MULTISPECIES: methionine ABC transporter permease [Acetobacter]|uniref:Putative D-methionine transport system permease protein MetI n=1 Tax=Acetobacter pomorum DM001 TaxID=945681 RepID=F1YSD8_9PROT|nr:MULTISPECIES: methionine ABC transporter permease [Acetobacter]ATI12700.1 ABC transporter permease [Acetobacter pomorum]AXC27167.1 ABC transporter permease [Acetobacter sp. JWB]EGE48271.1 Putative D-methionine transport system permease protein MetI [Acetobacter pomorum DM001]KAA8426765.1 ABC transporter permease [Acetobacter pomorum]KAA8438102.1 ABC transporter permease [Acetobacter pomorum]